MGKLRPNYHRIESTSSNVTTIRTGFRQIRVWTDYRADQKGRPLEIRITGFNNSEVSIVFDKKRRK